jgi:hypothetical protein
MQELIEALQIFLKYGDQPHPTCCNHDELCVDYHRGQICPADLQRLEELGFHWDNERELFYSTRWGSN